MMIAAVSNFKMPNQLQQFSIAPIEK